MDVRTYVLRACTWLKARRKEALIVGLAATAVVGIIIALLHIASQHQLDMYTPAHYTGTQECLSYAKQIEGAALLDIPYLVCTSSSAEIGNSTTAIHKVAYGGGQSMKDATPAEELCADNNLEGGESDACGDANYKFVKFNGYLLGNGQTYTDLNEEFWTNDTYDHCVDSMADYSGHPQLTRQATPSLHDLYMYQGKLWQRVVFHNVKAQNGFGTCTLNGTILYSYLRDPHEAITNLKVTYSGFPTSCDDYIRPGVTQDQAMNCIDFVIAAHATPYVCGEKLALTGPNLSSNLVTDFAYDNYPFGGYDNDGINGCNAVYEQRMAELNRCNEISNSSWQDRCTRIRSNPNGAVELTSNSL